MNKSLLIIFLSLVLSGFIFEETQWLTDYSAAKQTAKQENKLILIRFSGSDWCGNCKKLEKQLFTNHKFLDFAKENIVLLLADFPRKRKNKLSKELTKQNEGLAEKYNQEGAFPKTVLVDHEGNLKGVMKYPLTTVEEYIAAIKTITTTN